MNRYRDTGSPAPVCRTPRLVRGLTILRQGLGLLNIIVKYTLLMEIQRAICSLSLSLLSPLAELASFVSTRERVHENMFQFPLETWVTTGREKWKLRETSQLLELRVSEWTLIATNEKNEIYVKLLSLSATALIEVEQHECVIMYVHQIQQDRSNV